MGMFDYIRYDGVEYQTKDTPQQTMDTYEIRENELWWKKCQYEWKDNDSRFGGFLEEISHEWIFCDDFDGVIDFYRAADMSDEWIEYHTLFNNGKLLKIEER